MLEISQDIGEKDLLQWIRNSIKHKSNIYSNGYQGQVYLYKGKTQQLILKAPKQGGVFGPIGRAMIRREYKVYARLSGVCGVPKCYGILDERYLVLEFIDGVSIRDATINNHKVFFEMLLDLIKTMHSRDVAHMDLKKKDNLLVVDGIKPYIVDFGAAIIRKHPFLPLNWYLYNRAKRFDFNAWVKLKYGGSFGNIGTEDVGYYKRTAEEKVTRWAKRRYKRLKKGLAKGDVFKNF